MTTHLKPRSASKVLYQGDDMVRLSELARAKAIAERRLALAEDEAGASARRVGDDTAESVTAAREALVEAESAYETFVDQAAERAVTVAIQAIGRRRFVAVVAGHPPRMVDSEPDAEGNTRSVEHPDDATFGVNSETFPRALLTFRDGDFVTIAEPSFESGEAVESFVDDDLAEGDFDELWMAAFMLNRGPSQDPKAFGG